MKMSGSQIVLEVLLEQGTDTVFGYPGGSILFIYDEIYKYRDRIRHVMSAHEQGAAHAADGYARATGKTGVVFATSGPGSTNLVTGIATAFMDSVPMVAITTNVVGNLIGYDAFQEVHITGITMPITKHNFLVSKIEDLADTLRDAFRIANSGRCGPVLVDITKDVTFAMGEYSPKPAVVANPKPEPDAKAIAEAARVINEAERPVVYFGGGVVGAEASALLSEFLHKASIPACHTIMAIGALPTGDPLNLGMIGMHGKVSSGLAVDNADVLIAIGARFSDRVATKPTDFAKSATIIHIDIDRTEIDKNVPSQMKLLGDVGKALARLIPLIKPCDRAEWLAQVDAWRAQDLVPGPCEDSLRPYQLVRAISDKLGPDGVLVTDVGQHQMWAAQYADRSRPRSFLTSGGLGTMGFGYGAAVGAQVGCPDRRVVLVTGDGSFHMDLNELATAVSENLPVVTVVFNNGVLGMVRQWQTLFYDKRYSCTSPERKTDFVKLAEAFGAKGLRANTPAEFAACLEEAFLHDGPSVIDCRVDKDEMVLPMIATGKTIKEVLVC